MSRPELVMCCIELGLDWHRLSVNEMKDLIRKEADKRWKLKSFPHSGDKISDTLKKFLTTEYDYKIYDRVGNEVKFK